MTHAAPLRLPVLLTLGLLAACGGDGGNGPGPAMGAVEVAPSLSTSTFDDDGFAVRVAGVASQPVPVNADIVVEGLSPGSHPVEMTDVDPPCEVISQNPLSVMVVAGDTALASFDIECLNSANIALTTHTTGANADSDGYDLHLDGGPAVPLDINTTTTIVGVDAGEHEVAISGIAPNCAVQGGPATVPVTVAAGKTAHVSFEVICSAAP